MLYLLLLLLLTFIGVVVAHGFIKVKVTSPLSLHSSMWFFVISLGVVVNSDFINLPEESFYAFLIWYLVLYFILFVGEMQLLHVDTKKIYQEINITCSRYWILVIPACLSTLYEIYNVGTNGPVSFALNLRLATINEDYVGPTFHLVLYFYTFIMAMFVINSYSNSNKLNSIVIISWLVLFCIATMGKFAVITPIITYMTIYEFKKGINKKKLMLIIPIIIFAILILHFLRMASNDTSTVSSVLGTYIYAPLLALSQLPQTADANFGQYTFRFFYAVFNAIGLSPAPVNTILGYANVPSEVNVYTVMQPFYQDFSYFGVVLAAIFYGLFFSLLYGSARKGNVYSLLIYALVSISMLTSFFAETLITNLSGNIKLAICTIILFRLTTKWKIKQ